MRSTKFLLSLLAMALAITACTKPNTISRDIARNALKDYLPSAFEIQEFILDRVEGQAPDPVTAHFRAKIQPSGESLYVATRGNALDIARLEQQLVTKSPSHLLESHQAEVETAFRAQTFIREVFPTKNPVEIFGTISLVTLGEESQLRTPQMPQDQLQLIQSAKPRNAFPADALIEESPELRAWVDKLRKTLFAKADQAKASEAGLAQVALASREKILSSVDLPVAKELNNDAFPGLVLHLLRQSQGETSAIVTRYVKKKISSSPYIGLAADEFARADARKAAVDALDVKATEAAQVVLWKWPIYSSRALGEYDFKHAGFAVTISEEDYLNSLPDGVGFESVDGPLNVFIPVDEAKARAWASDRRTWQGRRLVMLLTVGGFKVASGDPPGRIVMAPVSIILQDGKGNTLFSKNLPALDSKKP
jgi:hypothetical protein